MRARGRGGLRVEERDDVGGGELLPHHGARARAPRARRAPSRSRRAASSAWIVSGRRAPRRARPRARARAAARGRAGFPRRPRRSGLADRTRESPPSRSTSASASSAASASTSIRSTFSRPLEECRVLLEEPSLRDADDEDGPGALVGEVLDELEERRLGPVEVVEDEDEWPLLRLRFAELPEPPRDLGSRTVACPPLVRPRSASRSSLSGACWSDLAERPVRDPVAVGQAAAEERRHALRAAGELGGEPGLAPPGSRRRPRPGHGAPSTARFERPAERRELSPATDERSIRDRRSKAGADRREARPAGTSGSGRVGSRTSSLSERLEPCGMVDETGDHLADHDLARRLRPARAGRRHRRRHPRRNVAARRSEVATTSPAAMPIRTSSPIPCSLPELRAQGGHTSLDVEARHGPPASRRPRVRPGIPNAAMTASPAYFSTVPPCRVERGRHRVEVALEHQPERLRVEGFRERHRLDDVDEEHRDEPPELHRRLRGRGLGRRSSDSSCRRIGRLQMAERRARLDPSSSTRVSRAAR